MANKETEEKGSLPCGQGKVWYANIIIDISHERVDRKFQYRIPEELLDEVKAGTQVLIPFGSGNRERKGYVMEITDQAEYDIDKIKAIAGIAAGSISAESQLIELAWWMKESYGSTMNQALKTVLPVKQKVKAVEKKSLRCLLSEEDLKEAIDEAARKKYRAREQLLRAFLEVPVIPCDTAVHQMNLQPSTWKPLAEKKILAVESEEVFRNPFQGVKSESKPLVLNEEQIQASSIFCRDYDEGKRKTYLIHGITGSGKTEVYMELIAHVCRLGKQVIVLIPEIALTYQTVMRFYKRFGSRVSIINSRLSAGERYDQFKRAKRGDIDIMIGPRSALFTPFAHLGLIIIDEEHEGAYKSEVAPRYHARETAIERARMSGASVVLGSATPSVEAYTRALDGTYRLLTLSQRAKHASELATVEVIDLREELKAGNKSIFSRILQNRIHACMERGEQIMLFINRRGYANFVSCRSCGEAIKCPHCDVSLTLHNNRQLVCHYCGYHISMPKQCPSCNSPYIANFGTGTQKIEEMAKTLFPQARILRMDLDTTSKKGGHEEILTAFSRGEADILIGTQMIVKGHDFPNVTLVGVMAADLSLNTPDYHCAERTFQLLTQAAGRAGRDEKHGNVVIQTYNPEHYSIVNAAKQDYQGFYQEEMTYRKLLNYPPACSLLTIQLACPSEELLNRAMAAMSSWVEKIGASVKLQIIGPAEAPIYKVNDIYRKILYMKHENYDILIKIKNKLEKLIAGSEGFLPISVQYDFS